MLKWIFKFFGYIPKDSQYVCTHCRKVIAIYCDQVMIDRINNVKKASS